MTQAKKAKASASTSRKGSQVNKPVSSGEFEVNTTAKPNAAASTLPSFRQFITLALAKAEHELKVLIDIRCRDDDWSDDDVSVDNVTELALSQIQAMKGMDFNGSDDFYQHWFRVGAAMELAQKAFSRQGCVYANLLRSICSMFEQAFAFAEFVEVRAKGGV